jgi:dihydrofolate reductase
MKKTVYVNPWGGVISGKYSVSAITFMQDLEQLEYLIFYVLAAERLFGTRYDEFRDESLDYIQSLGPKFKETFKQIISKKADRLILSGKTYESLLSQMAYSRSIDNFLLYLKNILAEVIDSKPQLLKSGETERLDFVLQFDDINELRRALAKKKVENLFYGGFSEICKFYQSRLGIDLVKSQEDLNRLTMMTKIRNLIAHNAGKVNLEFKKEFPSYPIDVGESVRFSYREILDENALILKSVEFIDDRITKKFGLSLLPMKESA